MSSTVSKSIWSNFSKRSQSLSLKNKALKTALLSPDLPFGPASLKKRSSKAQYNSPIGLSEIYPLAYQILEQESVDCYKRIEKIESKISTTQDQTLKEELNDLKQQLLVDAEINNPEVIYNANYATNSLDRTQPVYRHYLKEQWKSYSRMLTMQRLESLSVIPDTLPTLDPQVDVQLKFPHNNVERWIEPGTLLSSNATCKPPLLEIVEFKESKNDLYTVLMVDPDTPDLTNDSFSTTLHWGLKDVQLSNEDPIIDAKKLVENPDYEFIEYLPPVPEKNTGKHRLAIWVFRQNEKLSNVTETSREFFDIRKFTEDHNLVPIGAHVFRSIWDRNTENVRETYGLPKGRIFTRERL
ncbi:hypothetical protein CANARDRAFT_28171 [[Candida] arabinofermentans NRRL YB-2248]|uniref:Large ribosomal subunit protein mL38 n=1 Tax=[Candida] arabinofermentans NRRL YB-2248 TaxID=983967 RepID=A0A1E4T0W1_9ASCO|nr:hypothetical protein CANARDRAFT_28171 [[Candida] arabinofermentans NRRL YB-2248]